MTRARARLLSGLGAMLVAGVSPARVTAAGFDDYATLTVQPGTWTYRADAGGSEARFAALLSIRCDRASRRVSLTRLGALDPAARLTVMTDSATRTIDPAAPLGAFDPLLDAVAFSRGRLIMWSGALTPVVAIPVWPDAARSIEDCRV